MPQTQTRRATNRKRRSALSDEEKLTLSEIRDFKNPRDGWFERITDGADTPLDKIGDALFENALGERFDDAVTRVIDLLNDAAGWTVRQEAIFEEFRDEGFDVDDVSDIEDLTVEQIREVARGLDTKYRIAATGEGVVTGALGPVGAPMDLPLLVGLALRASNEYATYFGFDIETDEEKCYVMALLAVACAVTDDAKQETLREITRVALALAGDRSGSDAQRRMTKDLVEKIAEALVMRLAKGKLAQVVPIVGAAIGGGYNLRFIGEVCRTAEMLYAERWLIRAHGPGVAVEVASTPPKKPAHD